MNKAGIKFWKSELATLDTLYAARLVTWQRQFDAYDLKFKAQIRDLSRDKYVRVSEFVPVVRQIIGSVAMNYPRLFFEVFEDEAAGQDIEDLLERSSAAMFEIANAKAHVHQAGLDALFCGVGWVRTDVDPVGGDDINEPWAANDPDSEDLVAFSRVPPWHVHIDPHTQPHMLGSCRYIREKVLVPLKSLLEDKSIKHKGEIKKSGTEVVDEIGTGQLLYSTSDEDEAKAVKDSIENGEFVWCDRIHVRKTHLSDRQLIMFVPGVDEPVMERPHPFMRRVFSQRMERGIDPDTLEMTDMPMFDPDTAEVSGFEGEPVMDLETRHKDGDLGVPGVGMLVQHGVPFVPIRFDMHPTSFHPVSQLEYIEDLQDLAIEILSRKAASQKRFSRMSTVTQAEVDANPEIAEKYQRGEDGELLVVVNKDNFGVLDSSGVPAGEDALLNIARGYTDRITRVNQLGNQDAANITATVGAIIGASESINERWMEQAFSKMYVDLARNGFQIMGDLRYTPENFIQNVAPDGQQQMSRVLTSADFLWHYRITVQAGSMQPLFKQMQEDKALAFYDRAIRSPNFDARELDKMMASLFDAVGDPEKLMKSQENVEAQRAAQLENDRMISQQQDPGVLPDQDHAAHIPIHGGWQQQPMVQQLMQQSQQRYDTGEVAFPQAAAQLQQIGQLINQHLQAHVQAQEEQQMGSTGAPGTSNLGQETLQAQVASNAQLVSQAAKVEAAQEAVR